MSRVGKKPISIPDNSKISYENRVITVQGEKGTLQRTVHPDVDLKIEDKILSVTLDNVTRTSRALQGLTRSLIANMITGVSKGFDRQLEINGIGYRAELKGKCIVFNLGYSHPINFDLPDGVSATVEKTIVKLSAIDKELLGHTAAAVRRLRPPEPYKGKGVKYVEERIQRKAGKTGTK
jgi:large subunit ribosomal protein L6